MKSQGNILITDDEPDLRRALNRTLHALGFEITEAANGEQALERMEAAGSTPFYWTSICRV
jgi:CheY-like chemotaxis protein